MIVFLFCFVYKIKCPTRSPTGSSRLLGRRRTVKPTLALASKLGTTHPSTRCSATDSPDPIQWEARRATAAGNNMGEGAVTHSPWVHWVATAPYPPTHTCYSVAGNAWTTGRKYLTAETPGNCSSVQSRGVSAVSGGL